VDDHKFRIHTGYGLEGELPDLLTKKIQDENMRPFFKQQDYYSGIDRGVNKLIYYSEHAYVPDPNDKKESEPDPHAFPWMTLLISLSPFYLINLGFAAKPYYHLFTKRGKIFDTKKKRMVALVFFLLLLIPLIGGIIIAAYGFKTNLVPPYQGGSGGTTFSGGTSHSYSSSHSSSYSSSSGFSGGGGGDSGGGGSSSDW
jgi:uncharacterized protein